MTLKNFDVKQFLLDKGERIGLYAAAGIMALLLVLGLKSVFGNSASANETALKNLITQKKDLIQRKQPTADEAKELATPDPGLERAMSFTAVKAEQYPNSVAFFEPEAVADDKRRGPRVKLPVEYAAATTGAQVRTYRLSDDRERILVLKGASGDKSSTMKANRGMFDYLKKANNRLNGMMGPGAGGTSGGAGGGGMNPPPPAGSSMSGPPGGMMGSSFLRRPGMMAMEQDTDSKRPTQMVKIEDLEKMPDAEPAEDITPVRMAIVVGSFPYKEQLEEFRAALRFNSLAELLNSDSAPQFKGFDVQRAEVKPGDTEDKLVWKDLDLEKTFTPLYLLGGRRPEPDPPELDPVSFDGLTMPRPLQFRENQYPKVEDQLKHVSDTLADLKKAAQGTLAKPKNRFKDAEGLDIFSKAGSSTAGDEGGMTAPGTMPAGAAMSKGQMMRPMTGGEGPTNFNGELIVPEYILLRFLDVTIEPGKAYRYRIKVRMVNPNFQRKDVAWASLAADKELKSDWAEVDKTVQVPPELYYYAIDLKTQGSSEEKKALWNAESPKANQVPVQAHRWIENVYPDPKNPRSGFSVGDWCIAERTLVTRGEYLGHTENVEVPIWDISGERFSLASYKRSKKVPVFFGPEGAPDSMVVDFQGGFLDYSKINGMEDDKYKYEPIRADKAPVELLIMSADGRLSVRHGDQDMDDKDRQDREKAYKDRIQEIKGESRPKNAPGGNPANPFGRS